MKMTPHELMLKTVKDIEIRKKNREEGIKQADMHAFANKERIKKRLEYGKY